MNLRLVKPNKTTGTSVDTIIITKDIVKEWKLPPFQRPLKANAKVLELAEELKENGGVFPGILTIGVLKGVKYLADGQHRCYAFQLSEIEEGYSDVRYRHYESMAEMAEDFVLLNSSLVKMRPDDIMRGLESSHEGLSLLRKKCPVIGYDQIRRGTASPVVSMSALLRCWFGAGREVPGSFSVSSVEITKLLSIDEAEELATFMNSAVAAWGRDAEYHRLYSNINLTLCMWLYRNCVLKQFSAKSPKLTRTVFQKAMQALSTDSAYIEWLLGRNMSERDRAPCYRRIKQTFIKRLETELGKKVSLPQPEWARG